MIEKLVFLIHNQLVKSTEKRKKWYSYYTIVVSIEVEVFIVNYDQEMMLKKNSLNVSYDLVYVHRPKSQLALVEPIW
jgi:hypothetical protein